MSRRIFFSSALCLALMLAGNSAFAQRQMEKLGRGVVAMRTSGTQVYVGWRMFGTDPENIGFKLYRVASGATNVLNGGNLLTNTTDFVDTPPSLTVANIYFVQPVTNGVAQANSAAYTLIANAPTQQYISIPLTPPPGGTEPASADGTDAGGPYTYNANDCSVGDVDGDGEYEIILKWDPSNSKDNSQSGFTGDTYLDCYKLDGTRLWRIDLGPNVRSGAHYMDFMVYDYDGDGKAEVMCRTGVGAKDGLGNYVGSVAKWQNANGPHPTFNNTDDYRTTGPNGVNGYVLAGPEFLSVFNGQTGEEMATATYYPKRDQDNNDDNPTAARINTIWGDSYGNRIDRFLAGVAYLDGKQPSGIFCRGYYTRACLAAWDWRNGQLTRRWTFDSNDGNVTNLNYRNMGAHSLTIGDVDGDGKDEITYGACAIDDNGQGLYSTLLGHGDALHLSDMDPNRPGLEVWMVHEEPGNYGPNGMEFRDARTGALIFGVPGGSGQDVGRGVAYDVDPRYPGYEMWGAATGSGLYNAQGGLISSSHPSQENFCIWWDSDLLRETLDGTTVSKWNWTNNTSSSLLAPSGLTSNNGTKSTPCLSADILGDWREEVIWRNTANTELRIYTTTIPATNRLYTLMHDPQYRCAIAWQNTGYNQPPHPGFFLGQGMLPQPLAPISEAKLVWRGAATGNNWDNSTANWLTNGVWTNSNPATVFNSGDSVLFDISGSNNIPVNFTNAVSPGKVTVFSPKDYIFNGTGSLAGATALVKAGQGRLTINTTNGYTGPTTVSGGALIVNGSLDASPVTVERRGTPEGTARFGGGGRLGQGLTIQKDCGLIVGPGTNSAGTLTISNNLTELGNVLNQFDLTSDQTGLTKTNDRVNIVGNLVLTGTNIIQINQPDVNLGGGVYPLFSYSGTLTGGLTNLTLTGTFIQPVVLTNPPGMIAVLAIIPAAPPNAPTGLGATAIGAFQINLAWTDNSSDENGFIIERSTNNVNFSRITSVGANDNDYSDSRLAPATTYYYRVASTNLAGMSAYSGTSSATTFLPAAALTWRGDGTNNVWDVTTTANWFDGANVVVYSDGVDATFNQNGSNNPTINLTNALTPNSVTVNATKSYTFGGTGVLGGSMSLVKSGSGGLTLNSSNAFTGGVMLNNGTLTLANLFSASHGTIILNGGNLLLSVSGAPAVFGNPVQVAAASTLSVAGSGNNNEALNGILTGSNTLTFSIASGGTFSMEGNMTAFNGTISLGNSAGTFRFFNTSAGSTQAVFNLGTGSASIVNRDGSALFHLGGLSGGPGTFLRGRSSSSGGSGSTYEIGGANINTTFQGQITNGNDVVSITKTGSGMLTLTGSNTYTGTTTINAGTLLVNGNNSNAVGQVIVVTGGTLGGSGVIGGNTTVNGTLSPGSNSIGTLTFTNNLTFSGSGTAFFELARNPITNDVARVLGTVTYAGTLSVANVSPDFLLAGDNFRLFNTASYSGVFTNFDLPDLNDGLDWSTNRLGVDGRLWVVKTTPPLVTSNSVSGGNFSLGGNGGTPNWSYYVLASTNLTLPMTNWTRVATNQFSATGTFACTISNLINPGLPMQFYLIQSQ